jgi:hypothetical protein
MWKLLDKFITRGKLKKAKLKTREQIEMMALRAFKGLGLAAGEEALIELKQGWCNAAYNVRLTDGRVVLLKNRPAKKLRSHFLRKEDHGDRGCLNAPGPEKSGYPRA